MPTVLRQCCKMTADESCRSCDADAHAVTEALLALSCDSREAVDALVARAVAAGGAAPNAAEDHGFMYDHGFEDLDGHMWGVFWMNDAATPSHATSRSSGSAPQRPRAASRAARSPVCASTEVAQTTTTSCWFDSTS